MDRSFQFGESASRHRTHMDDERILVRANIRLLSTAEGGRTTPIRGSYRPNHNFFGPDDRNMTVGFIDLPEGKELHPGAICRLCFGTGQD